MDFDRIAFNRGQAATELASFKAWISARPFFAETEAVAEIKRRRHMACLLGFTVLMPNPDLIKFELEVKGLFRADLAIGNDGGRIFVLVEFEPGEANSIFSGGTKKYRHWSRQLEHGFGQVIDWGWAKHDHPHDSVFTNTFGGKVVDDSYVVICGRDPLAGSIEEKRFDFRRSRLKLSGVTVQFLTYDGMVKAMSDRLDGLSS
jgi:hypothetical protein